MKKQKEIEEANEAQRKKVIVTFDLLGRKVGTRDFFPFVGINFKKFCYKFLVVDRQ